MYSHEIEQLLKLKKYLLSIDEYINILQTSPQIYYVNYDKEKDMFELNTDDGYEFKFKVKARNKS